MDRLFAILMLFIFLGATTVAPDPPRLIVRGDDMGSSHAGNEAILHCALNGIQTSIEIMVPTPWFPEAVQMLAEHPDIDVGLHLSLTSEWDNIKWRPLTICPSITDEDGYFYPMIHPNPNYPQRSIKENEWKLAEIEAEMRAQIEMAKRNIKNLTHISGHMGCTSFDPKVAEMAKRLAKEYDLDIDLVEHNVTYIPYDGPHITAKEKIDSFIKQLHAMEAGKTYLFVEHPAYDNAEMRAVYHIGYENVAADRQGVTDLFTSELVKQVIKDLGIELISYADLVR
ncbi:MAG: polysaccharide deacetylase family protein [Bacteroidota bacterium]